MMETGGKREGGGGGARGGSHRGCQPSEEQSHHVEANVPLPTAGAWRGGTKTRRKTWETQMKGGVVRTWGGGRRKKADSVNYFSI